MEFGDVGVYGGRKTRKPAEKASEQGENDNKLYSHGTRLELNPGHIGGRPVLSPLYHLWSPVSDNKTPFYHVKFFKVEGRVSLFLPT